MKKLLTTLNQKHMEELLMEPKIAEAVFSDIGKREYFKFSQINEDGTLTLGKRSVQWWNRLFGLEKTISFKDFCFNVLRALVGMAENLDKNTILQGLSRELIAKAVLEEKYDFVVERLLDVARYGIKDSVLSAMATPANGKPMPENFRRENPSVGVNVALENRGLIPIYDSVGNVLLHLRVKVDGYTLDRY